MQDFSLNGAFTHAGLLPQRSIYPYRTSPGLISQYLALNKTVNLPSPALTLTLTLTLTLIPKPNPDSNPNPNPDAPMTLAPDISTIPNSWL